MAAINKGGEMRSWPDFEADGLEAASALVAMI
jgi:hypothetical protein